MMRIWNFRSANLLLPWTGRLENVRDLSNKSAYITKIRRKLFLRQYPTVIVDPDGSTYTIRHYEPRRIIKLPIDVSKLSEEELQKVMEIRKPKKKVVIEEEIDDNFDSKKYLKVMKGLKS